MEDEIRAQLMANQQMIADEETAGDWDNKVCIDPSILPSNTFSLKWPSAFIFFLEKNNSVLFLTKYFSNFILEKCIIILLSLPKNSILRAIKNFGKNSF
jgi:hypothetical protein